MGKEYKQLSWIVKNFNFNKQAIEDYDILSGREDFIKKLKKICENKETFSDILKREFMYHFWSRAEWEIIVEITPEGHILLKPWVGCYSNKEATLDVTNDTSFDWKGFAKYHTDRQIYGNRAKVDVFCQLVYGDNWDKLVTYLWTTRLKYERSDPKFEE